MNDFIDPAAEHRPAPASADPVEARRLKRLRSLEVMDSEPEAIFEQITRLAADLCGAPMALISLVDEQRQWFKSNVGLQGVTQTRRDLAFCAHAIAGDELFEVRDASRDARFAANPLVTGEPQIRFYAGAPLVMPEGERMGTLCVIDRAPRQLGEIQRTALTGLAQLAATALLQREQRLATARELQATENQYRLIVEGQSELVSLADRDGSLVFVNAAYARFFGREPEQMVGWPLVDFVEVKDRAAVVDHLHSVLDSHGEAQGVNRMLSVDGRERWIAWTNRAVWVEDGQHWCVHSVGRDISEQHAAERALAESERRSRALYEATPAMLQSIDAEGRIVAVSDVWLAKLGYRRAEVLGRDTLDFYPAEDRRYAIETGLPEFFRSGRTDELDLRMVRRDGTLLPLRLSAVLERDLDGVPLRSLAVLQDMTDKLAADAAIEQSRRMLQLVLDNVPARISYWDTDSRLQVANSTFLAQFGRDAEEAIGRHVEAVLGAQWHARIRTAIDRGLRHGQASRFDVSVRSAEESRENIMEMHFIPDIRDAQVQGLLVFSLDVTERRIAERELVAQEKRFRLLVDGVRDYAIYMLDAAGHVAIWNAGAERNKGYRADEVLGRHFGIFFTPEDRAAGKPEAALAIARRDGRYEAEDWRRRSDGSRFWASVLLTSLQDEQGKLIGYAKITRDLTERKQQQSLLVRIAELAPCAIVLVDAGGRVAMVNAETERIFGYSRDELLGKRMDLLVPAHAASGPEEVDEALTPNGGARGLGERELYGLRKDGSEFPVEIGLSQIESPDGFNTLVAILDITGRRAQQRETERMLAEKETLLKEVYHRVKNNLQVVQSLLTLKRHALPEGAARDALHDSVQRVRAMALVHEKLYQSGDLAAVPLAAYTRDLLQQISAAQGTAGRRIRLSTDIAEIESGLDSAVPFGLLLAELVTNCLKHGFTGRDSGEIQVSVKPQLDGDLLTVADDGVGLPPGLDPAVEPASMGLQLAHALAEQLGGELKLHTDGGGTVASALLQRLRRAGSEGDRGRPGEAPA